MSDFRELSDSVFASPQIGAEDLVAAEALGVSLVINNRPDGEAPDQPDGAAIEAAARAAGMDYRAIPVTMAGLSEPQVAAMAEALANAQGKVLAYCRSGTRSTLLWALTQAREGRPVEEIATAATAAGYDIAPIRPALEMFAARAQS